MMEQSKRGEIYWANKKQKKLDLRILDKAFEIDGPNSEEEYENVGNSDAAENYTGVDEIQAGNNGK